MSNRQLQRKTVDCFTDDVIVFQFLDGCLCGLVKTLGLSHVITILINNKEFGLDFLYMLREMIYSLNCLDRGRC